MVQIARGSGSAQDRLAIVDRCESRLEVLLDCAYGVVVPRVGTIFQRLRYSRVCRRGIAPQMSPGNCKTPLFWSGVLCVFGCGDSQHIWQTLRFAADSVAPL
jgi:hypothetical protein